MSSIAFHVAAYINLTNISSMSLSRAKGAAQYKKLDGEVSLSSDGKTIIWTPNKAGSAPSVKLATEHLTNLQQTPATSAKAVLKLFVQTPGASAPETYNFTFSSPSTARDELNAFIEPLKKILESQRTGAVSAMVSPSPTPGPGGQGQADSMTMAQTVSGGSKDAADDAYSDSQLLANVAFQKALIEQNPSLRERLAQAIRDKPASMTSGQLSKQFWTSRLHLLRAYAAEQAQKKGEYYVIADIKPVRTQSGDMKYDFTPAKFKIIFNQYPFMVKIHTELFRKKVFKTEAEFWGEWITSRLYKKMKGERITEQDWEHPHFDRYLDLVDTSSRPKHFTVDHIPRFIDMTGNEQNHSQKKGNAPDFTMQPAFNGRNAILNTLNNMSERLLMNVTPSDNDSHGPVGLDEDAYNELRLRDLQRNDEDNRIVLDISDQRKIAPTTESNGTALLSADAVTKALRGVRSSANAQPTLPVDIDEDEEPQAIYATTNMMKSIKLRASHSTSDQIAQDNISAKTKDSTIMAHSTTIDFLHYFWGAYLSGDVTRAEDVKFLYETLQGSKARCDAVADQGEQERQTQLEHIQGMEKDMPPNKRRRIDRSRLPGGRQAVYNMLAATQQAVSFVEQEYRKTLAQQSAATS
jgi:transcription initiation factor TFIIH subunit 1